MATRITSDGTGNWIKASRDDKVTSDILDQNKAIIQTQSAFQDLPTHIEAKNIPDAFAKAFNKILEFEYDGITYRYKELNFMELLAHGQNPYSLELTRIANSDKDKDKDEILEDFERLPIEQKLDLQITEDMRRKNLLNDSLVDMRVGEEVLKIDSKIINSMTQEVRDHLFGVITREGAAETEAIDRFHQLHGSKFGDSDLSDGENV